MIKDPKTSEDNNQSGNQQDQGQGTSAEDSTSSQDYVRGGDLHEMEDKGQNPDIPGED